MKSLLMVALFATVAFAGCSSAPVDDCIKSNDFVTPHQDADGNYIVCMLGENQFAPAKAEVPVGATVVWINKGGVHNTVSDDDLWRSEITSGDGGVNHMQTFAEAGDYDYHCQPHQSLGMVGTIRVV